MDDRNRRAGRCEVDAVKPTVTYGGQTSLARTAITAVASPMTKMMSPRTKGPTGQGRGGHPRRGGLRDGM